MGYFITSVKLLKYRNAFNGEIIYEFSYIHFHNGEIVTMGPLQLMVIKLRSGTSKPKRLHSLFLDVPVRSLLSKVVDFLLCDRSAAKGPLQTLIHFWNSTTTTELQN